MRDRFRSQVLALCGALVVAAGSAQAQSAEVNAGVQLNLSTPGARSLGLGGAFIGLADDATAAYANPAGLTLLSDPEVSFEARNGEFRNTFVQGGRLDGSSTGMGIDTVAGLVTGENDETVSGTSFLSAVYPGRIWAVALYRHELAKYHASFRTDGVFTPEGGRTLPKDNTFDLAITGLGLSMAVRLGDRLSLGAGVVSYDFSVLSRTDRYSISEPDTTGPGGFYGPSLYTPETLVDTRTQSRDERRIGINAGFRYNMAPGWTVGGVYRQGPELRLNGLYIPGPRAAEATDFFPTETRSARYDLPEILGAGVAYQPTELLTFALDYVHVEYSDLADGILDILLLRGEMDFSPEASLFKADDAGEIHLGAESIVPFRRALVALRAGAWYDPDHRIRYEGENPLFQAAFRPGEDEVHYAAGFGLVIPRWELRIDAGFDYSDPVKTASLSTVLYF